MDISLSTVMTLANGNAAGSSRAGQPSKSSANSAPAVGKGKARATQVEDDSDSDSNSEIDAQENALARKGKGKANAVKAFEQRDLVALAFAGDNVVQVSYSYSDMTVRTLIVVVRISLRQNGARSRKTHLKRSTPRCPAG